MSKNDVNVKKLIQETVDGLVDTITTMIEARTEESLRERLSSLLDGHGTDAGTTRRVVNVTKRRSQRPPCPFPGCKEFGAPRYHQLCVAHGRDLKEKGKEGEVMSEMLIAVAKQPGGVWYKEAREKQKPGRKPKLKVPAVTATPLAPIAASAPATF